MTDDERFVEIDPNDLDPDTLRAVLEEFVSREGTDYGHEEWSFDDKVEDVARQLRHGEARIVFDRDEETVNLVPTRPGPRRRL